MSVIYTPHYRGEQIANSGLWQISQDVKKMPNNELCEEHYRIQTYSITSYLLAKKWGSTDMYIQHRRNQPGALIYWREIQRRAGWPNLGAIA